MLRVSDIDGQIITWDHNEQVCAYELTNAATSGHIHFHHVETDSDQMALVATVQGITVEQAQEFYDYLTHYSADYRL